MNLRTILLFAVCGLSIGLCGCGDSVPSEEEAAEMNAEMDAEMQEMQMMLPSDPSESTMPATSEETAAPEGTN